MTTCGVMFYPVSSTGITTLRGDFETRSGFNCFLLVCDDVITIQIYCTMLDNKIKYTTFVTMMTILLSPTFIMTVDGNGNC